jgi:hypothetical protein
MTVEDWTTASTKASNVPRCVENHQALIAIAALLTHSDA